MMDTRFVDREDYLDIIILYEEVLLHLDVPSEFE